jgi:hypothetical protein
MGHQPEFISTKRHRHRRVAATAVAGATAMCFKCVWPSRFGPNALLAAKVMRDPRSEDLRTLHSFVYEATVLATAM